MAGRSLFLLVAILCFQAYECYKAAKSDAGLYMIPKPHEKTEYLIGGWSPGDTIALFMKRFKPIFQDYLTKEIGPLYQPPIQFKLIPTDWTELGNETTTSHMLIEEGQLDFACKIFGLYCVNKRPVSD
jgi:hypothetical protein